MSIENIALMPSAWADPYSQIVLYNNCVRVISFGILLDETLIYVSGKTTEWDTCIIHLKDLNIPPGTVFRIKAIVGGGNDFVFNNYLSYQPDSNTIYFEISTHNTDDFIGYSCTGVILSPLSPPILKCSSIAAKHADGGVVLRWGITTENGSLIFKSGRCPKGNTLNYNLSNLNVANGILLKLKAIVTAGKDSVAYITLQYDPTSSTVAHFYFYGNAFKTVVIYND